MTKADLEQQAADIDLAGASMMSKDQLQGTLEESAAVWPDSPGPGTRSELRTLHERPRGPVAPAGRGARVPTPGAPSRPDPSVCRGRSGRRAPWGRRPA